MYKRLVAMKKITGTLYLESRKHIKLSNAAIVMTNVYAQSAHEDETKNTIG